METDAATPPPRCSRASPTGRSCSSTVSSRPGRRRRSSPRPDACASSCSRTWCRRPSRTPTRRAIDRERRALRAAHRVIATSEWTKRELVRRGLAPADRIDVATPGADAAAVSPGTPSGRALLCVGVVAPHKGQDTLVEALAALAAQPEWTCTIAGSLAARPDFAERIAARAQRGRRGRPHHDGRRARPGRPRRRLPPGRPARRALARRELRHGDRRGAAPRHPDRREQRGRGAADRRARPRRCSCRRISPPRCVRRWSTGWSIPACARG